MASHPTGGADATKKDATTAKSERKEVFVDRVMKDVVSPPMWPMTKEELYDKNNMPNLSALKDHLLKEGRLEIDAAESLIERCSAQFKEEPNMLELRYPLTVCGDVHGQFFDLIRLFEVGGDPKDTQYLFLGDYVDRGCFSTEVVFYLYALKITYPKTFFMLRGNHECRQLTSFFNFKDECAYKYNLGIYDKIMSSFDNLPLSALINKAFFCVHGGLSPDLTSLDEVKSMDRFVEIPREGPMCDLLWSDPYEEDADPNNPDKVANKENPDDGTHGHHETQATSWFGYNDTRQCSYVYGVEAVKQFLKDNKLTSIIRAHEAQVDGYKMQMVNKTSGIPRVITIFSAPNYCDVYKNKAACLKFDNNVLNIKQFIDSPHPYYLPNFMDVFQWSLPFVAEKVTDMLANVLEYDGEDSDEEEETLPDGTVVKKKKKDRAEAKETVIETRGGLLKKKVLAVTKILRMYKTLRQEHESIVQLKQLTPNHKIPLGLLREGSDKIKEVLLSFETARKADSVNEVRPTAGGLISGKKSPELIEQKRVSFISKSKALVSSAIGGGAGAGPATASGAASSPIVIKKS